MDGGIPTLTDGTVIDNNAFGSGGGIYKTGTLTVTGGTVESNTSGATVPTFVPPDFYANGAGNGDGLGVQGGYGNHAIAVGDFDENGKSDLAVAGAIAVLLGLGGSVHPLFDPTNPFLTLVPGCETTAIVEADLNGDGHQDIAVTCGSSFGSPDPTVWVLLGNGTGTFASPQPFYFPFLTVERPESLEVGDFNNDHKPDLAVVSDATDNVAILLNTTSATSGWGNIPATAVTFGTPPLVPNNGYPRAFSIAVADLNNDSTRTWQ